ncbi:MAG: hypothetical protein JKX85_14330 [Phycisphaeraceae bacterium]|nr:hypothetical protein [Phycisphaeraceae bacterium]
MQVITANAQPLGAYKPAENQPILTLDQITPGMRGYGLSVFNGTAIEPFEVQVISVNFGLAPGVGAIWIRCPDKRMQLNGVVQGMSGSPIYLWPKQDPNAPKANHVLGKGGKLIGAFAFGYGRSKDCFVGVKPIELMRQVATRATHESIKDIKQSAKTANRHATVQMMSTLKQLAQLQQLPESQIKLLDQYLNLAQGPIAQRKTQSTITSYPLSFNKGTQPKQAAQASPLLMPLALSTPGLASLLSPLFEPLGIAPVQAPANSSSKLPSWIDPDKLQLRPGSSLSVPLAWGDMDMAATGTVTDVLKDGTILGFGHAMSNDGKQGIGTINLPVATGFIHTVMPSNDISFKLGGTARITGTMIRDENAAVIAVPDHYYSSAKVTVKVHQYQQQPHTFSYQVARHPQYTALLSAILPIQSLNAFSGGPEQNTLFLSATMTFVNGKTLTIERIIPGGGAMEIMTAILPPISLMANNAFESVPLKKMDVQLNVVPELLIGSIIKASLDQTEIAPGKEVGINFTVLPFGKPEKTFRTFLKIPDNTPDGDYQLLIVGARTYAAMMLSSRPHRTHATNTDQLLEALRMISSGQDDRTYVLLQTKNKGLAIGQNELPLLPSSRVSLITNPTSTTTTPYEQWIEQPIDTGLVIRSNVRFTLGIRSNLAIEAESD